MEVNKDTWYWLCIRIKYLRPEDDLFLPWNFDLKIPAYMKSRI